MKPQLDKIQTRLTEAAEEIRQITLQDASADTCYTVGRVFALIETTRMLLECIADTGAMGC